MESFIFLISLLALIVFVVRIFIKFSQHKNIFPDLKKTGLLIICYGVLWSVFYFERKDLAIPLGTDICFDDWCATVVHAEQRKNLGTDTPKGQYIILQIRMSNHARGISQKPSEPRIHITAEGHWWGYSAEGQKALEKLAGKQIPIDERLGLGQSLETEVVFDIPKNVKVGKILIEEGPFITKLLFPTNSEVFDLILNDQ